MAVRTELTQRYWAKARREQERADEVGFLGVVDDGTWPGTAEADGFIYDIPYRPGYVYARIIAGASFEVCEVIQGPIGRSANRMVGFRREGAALVGLKLSAQSAVAGSGADAPSDWVPAHTHLTADITDLAAPLVPYTPTTPADWSPAPDDVGQALDALAATPTGVESIHYILTGHLGNVLSGHTGRVLLGHIPP